MPSRKTKARTTVVPVRNKDPGPLTQQSLNKDASNAVSDSTVVADQELPVSQPSKFVTPKTWTYRVRGIPVDLDWQATKSLIETTLGLRASELRSLASDPYKTRELVATMEVSQPPYGKLEPQPESEWQFPIPDTRTRNAREPSRLTITVDKHFHGLTPLNSFANTQKNCIDCVAISGLGGHAFGSFKDPNKLQDSRSETVNFIGHSLGGLIVKEALIQMKKSENAEDLENLRSTYGALFFGVPNRGMKTDSLRPMVLGGPNESFLLNLGSNSELLLVKSEAFYDAFEFKDSKVVSFFETELSPTATAVSHPECKQAIRNKRPETQFQNAMGRYTMEGPREYLVDRASATNGRPWEHDLNFVIGLKKDHSKLVKFSMRDVCYDEVCQVIADFTTKAENVIQLRTVPTKHEQKYDKDHEERLAVMEQQITPSWSTTNYARRRCLHSLYVADYKSKLGLIPSPVPGTCTWVTGHLKYRKWYSGKRQPIIWLLGAPGSGKSVISSYLVEELKKESEGSEELVIYFHCDKDQSLLSSAKAVLSSLIHQILVWNDCLIDHAVKEYEMGPNCFTNSFGALCTVLENVLQDSRCPKIHCVVDALDECQDSQAFLKEISTYYGTHIVDHANMSVDSPIRFLVTSQPNHPHEGNGLLSKLSTIIDMGAAENLKKRESDISQFIAERVANLPFASKTKRTVRTKLERGAEGMFLWASLVLDELALSPSWKVDQISKSTPKNLDERYKSFLSQIRPRNAAWAHKVIILVATALRPFTVTELYVALTLWDGQVGHINNTLDQNLVDDFKNDLRHCGSILRIQNMKSDKPLTHSGVVTLVHPTAKDFLIRNRNRVGNFHINLETAHVQLARICMEYIAYASLGDSNVPALIGEEPIGQRFRRAVMRVILLQGYSKRYPLLEYATRFWLEHCTMATDEPDQELRQYFYRFIRLDAKYWSWIWWRLNVPHSMSLQSLVRNEGQARISVRKTDEVYQTPQKQRAMVTDLAIGTMLFLMKDIQGSPLLGILWRANLHRLSFRDDDGKTVLHHAAQEGWAYSIKLLVEYMRTYINIQDNAKNTALHMAATPGGDGERKLQMAKSLLDEGATTEIEDASGMTPLILAVQFGMYDMIKMLLKIGGADIAAIDAYEGTEIDMALEICGDIVQPDGQTILKLLQRYRGHRPKDSLRDSWIWI